MENRLQAPADAFEQMLHAVVKMCNVLRSGTKNLTDRNLEARELQKRAFEWRQIWEQGLNEVQMAQDNEHFKCTYIEFGNQYQRSTPDPSSDEDLNQEEEDENSEKTAAIPSDTAAGGRQQGPPPAQKKVLRAQMEPANCDAPPTGLSMEEWQMIMEKRNAESPNQVSTSGTSPKVPDDSKKRKKKLPSDLRNEDQNQPAPAKKTRPVGSKFGDPMVLEELKVEDQGPLVSAPTSPLPDAWNEEDELSHGALEDEEQTTNEDREAIIAMKEEELDNVTKLCKALDRKAREEEYARQDV